MATTTKFNDGVRGGGGGRGKGCRNEGCKDSKNMGEKK
jgi:hypothetical protein